MRKDRYPINRKKQIAPIDSRVFMSQFIKNKAMKRQIKFRGLHTQDGGQEG